MSDDQIKRPYQAKVFDPKYPVYATKDFRASGREIKAGQKFNWKQMSVSERKVRQLFDINLVNHGEKVAEEAVAEKAVAVDPAPSPKKAVAKKSKAETGTSKAKTGTSKS